MHSFQIFGPGKHISLKQCKVLAAMFTEQSEVLH